MMETERNSTELSLTLLHTSSRAKHLEEQLSLHLQTLPSSDDPCDSDIGEFSFREEMDLSVRMNTLGDEDHAPDEESMFISPLYGRRVSVSMGEDRRDRLRVETRVGEVEIRREREWKWGWLAVCLVTCLAFSWIRIALGGNLRNRRPKQS